MSTSDKLVTVITEEKVIVNVQAVVQGVAQSGGGAVDSVFGRTGAITAKTGDYTAAQIGLGNVDNTSDINKPVSTLQQTEINSIKTHDYFVNADDWSDLVTALESGSYASIFIPNGTYTCTDNEANPIVAHANVKRLSFESKAGAIIDANCATNGLIQDFITIPSIDCVVDGCTIRNFGNGLYAAIKGTVNGSFSRATLVENCHFENILNNNSRCVQNCAAISLTAKNDSTVGPYGRGILAYDCYGVFNCRSEYLYTLAYGCENVVGNYVYKTGNAIAHSNSVDSNTINNCWRGIFLCSDIGAGNRINYAGLGDYVACTFHNTYRDNIDNTKLLTLDYSGITTGTERTQAFQDKDGTLALLESEISTKTTDYTITLNDDVILADGSISAVTITLPAVASCGGRSFTIKAIDITNIVKLATNALETIDGVSTDYTFANKYDSITVKSDGTQWWRLI